jgi:hypothetical protein
MKTKLICISIDLLVAAILAIMGTLFMKSNGKGCDFLSGYNMATSKERKNYDEVKICNYTGKTILVWTIFFIIGAVVDYFAPGVGVSLAFLLFIIALAYYIIYIRYIKFDEKFKINK